MDPRRSAAGARALLLVASGALWLGSCTLDLSRPRPGSVDGAVVSDGPQKQCVNTIECDDTLACTQDVCDKGICKHSILNNTCLIEGRCFGDGEKAPENSCNACKPAKAKDRWTIQPPCVETLDDPSFHPGQLYDVATASDGTIYVVDVGNHAVHQHKKSSWSTVVGGQPGFADGPVTLAKFNSPRGLAVDDKGAIYVADTDNHRIRRISGGQVTTVAGSGQAGSLDGAATTAQLDRPADVAVAADGKVYIADLGNHEIRLLDGGQLSTFAGDGTAGSADGTALAAKFDQITGLVVHSAGTLFVADSYAVRTIASGAVKTIAGAAVAGDAEGAATDARFREVHDLALASGGRLFISDFGNKRIRLYQSAKVSTAVDDRFGTQLSGARGIAVEPKGSVLFIDGNRLLRYRP